MKGISAWKISATRSSTLSNDPDVMSQSLAAQERPTFKKTTGRLPAGLGYREHDRKRPVQYSSLFPLLIWGVQIFFTTLTCHERLKE